MPLNNNFYCAFKNSNEPFSDDTPLISTTEEPQRRSMLYSSNYKHLTVKIKSKVKYYVVFLLAGHL